MVGKGAVTSKLILIFIIMKNITFIAEPIINKFCEISFKSFLKEYVKLYFSKYRASFKN